MKAARISESSSSAHCGEGGCSQLVPALELFRCRWVVGLKAVVVPLLENSLKTECAKAICTVKYLGWKI